MMLCLMKKKSSSLAYMSRPYSEAMVMSAAVTYTSYGMSSGEQTGDVITFAQFEEGDILTKLVTMQKALTNPITNKL